MTSLELASNNQIWLIMSKSTTYFYSLRNLHIPRKKTYFYTIYSFNMMVITSLTIYNMLSRI